MVVIVLPLLVMVFLSYKICTNLKRRTSTARFTDQKRCVTNLTLATTFVHVVLELPAIGLHVAAAVFVGLTAI